MQVQATAMVYALSFPWRKRKALRACFPGARVLFVDAVKHVPPGGTLVVWGLSSMPGLAAGVTVVHVEDGFLRSVGLGADWFRPVSWVVDYRGMYFDARVSSDLEVILASCDWSDDLLQRAAALRQRIVGSGLTKYNVGQGEWRRPQGDRRVILVPGQVETDASIHYGSPHVRTNLELLQRVRYNNPDAYVIYKPHPDVVAGLRLPGTQEAQAVDFCDELVVHVPMHQLLEKVDEVHVLTSLAGFEALLRGLKVVCYGQPFYSGWGLTQDVFPLARRTRRLTLDALVAGALILYPRYFTIQGQAGATPETAIDDLLAWRAKAGGRLPWWRCLWRQVLQLLARWEDGARRRRAP